MTPPKPIFDMSKIKPWPRWKLFLWPVLMPWRYRKITPKRLGDANKTIITPEWIATQRKRAALAEMVDIKTFHVALDRIEELEKDNERLGKLFVLMSKADQIHQKQLSEAREEIGRLTNKENQNGNV